MEKNKEIKYKEWSEHLRTTKEKSDYSIKRLDLLIISISSGGLYVLLEALRELRGADESINKCYAVICGVLFVITILINFISQISGYKANIFEEEYINIELDILSSNLEKDKKEKKKDKKGQKDKRLKEQDELDDKIKRYNNITEWSNIISAVTLVLGLIFLTLFIFGFIF